MRDEIRDNIIVTVICVGLAAVVVQSIFVMRQSGAAMERVPEVMEARLAAEFEKARQAAKQDIAETKKQLQAQMEAMLEELSNNIDRYKKNHKR